MQRTTLDAAVLEKLISAAVAAPSIHNTQPWRYRLNPDTATLEVRAAADRHLREIDPEARALHVSVGAALFNLRIAIAHFGWEPVVRLLPHAAEPDLLATVRPAGPPRGDGASRRDLFDVIWRRHSSRFPFSESSLPPSVLTELTEAAHSEGVSLSLPGPDEVARLLHLTAEGELRNSADADRRAETGSWLRDGGPDGMPGSVLGPQDAYGHVPVRDFSPLRPQDHRPPVAYERNPTIAVLTTADDRPADWLRAGQALEHVLLLVTAEGMQSSLLHQALEWPDLRWALRDSHSGPGYVQMLIRLGYGPAGPVTPRRPAREVIDESALSGSAG